MSWKFWKKDELALPDMNSSFGKGDYGLGTSTFGSSAAGNTGLDLSDHFQQGSSAQGMGTLPPPSSAPFGAQPSYAQGSSFSPPPALITPPSGSMGSEPMEHGSVSKDLEVIAAKLDTIRAQLEMLNARVGNLERGQPPGTYPKRPWY